MQTTNDVSRDSRLLRYALQLILILGFLTGGSSQISGWDEAAVQLLSLPVLALGLWRLSLLPASSTRNVALAVAGLVALVPLVQLLPISDASWLAADARRHLAGDLAVVGATHETAWSLMPDATERAFLFLVPPLALFVGVLGVGPQDRRQLLRTVLLLALFSLLLAFLQLGVPPESLLNPFPQWAAQFNGIFANQNHQGISLVLAVIIALSGMLASLARRDEGIGSAWKPWILGFFALFALCSLPLTQSRAAVLIGTLATGAVPLALGLFDRKRLRSSWSARAGLLASLALMAVGIWAAVEWMQVETVDQLREPLREAALQLGILHAPLGVGVGAFVEAFEQSMPQQLLIGGYINHVHNEYFQWWMEAGLLGLVAAGLALLAALWFGVSAIKRRDTYRPQSVAATLGLWALLAHSWVDYPMRTPTLAAVAGVLCGVMVAAACSRDARRRLSEPGARNP